MRDSLLTLGITILAVLAPVQSLMFALCGLIAIDLVTGLWRARRAKEKITSNGLRRTVTKVLAYNLAIITGFILEQYFVGSILPAAKIIASFIAVTEVKSILENVSVITGLDLKQLIFRLAQGQKDNVK